MIIAPDIGNYDVGKTTMSVSNYDIVPDVEKNVPVLLAADLNGTPFDVYLLQCSRNHAMAVIRPYARPRPGQEPAPLPGQEPALQLLSAL